VQTDSRSQPSEQLFRDFDKTAGLVRSFVADRYGEEGADGLYRDARKKYEENIPRIPRIPQTPEVQETIERIGRRSLSA